MRRFLRPGHDPARERLKRDLFQFNKVREARGRPGGDGGTEVAPSGVGGHPYLN